MMTRPEEWFHERATHYVEAQILFHLNEAGLFDQLDRDGPATVGVLSEALDLDPEVLACCLDYVHGVDQLFDRDEEGRYGLSEFGRKVLTRYSRDDVDRRNFNFFDVRVGAYGPVWAGLGRMLSGDVHYGETLRRAGSYAAQGVYKVAAQLAPAVRAAVEELGIAGLIEVGVPTGLLARLLPSAPGLQGVGLDRDGSALREAKERAAQLGVNGIEWVHGDFFRPDDWVGRVPDVEPQALASIHFHEFVADGGEKLKALIGGLRERLPGLYLVVVEQDRLPPSAEDDVSRTVWLYSHSNVLIHHLIKNARILSRDEWVSLFTDAGCRVERVQPLHYLGYHLYVFQV